MKKQLGQLVFVVAIVAVASPSAWAQRGQGGGFRSFGRDLLMLLDQKSVQEELKLSDDQLKQVAEKSKSAAASLEGLEREERQKKFAELAKANDKVVAAILKEEQLKRLKQISTQLRGPFDPEIAETLKVTKDQQDKADTIREEIGKEMQSLGQERNEETRKKRAALRKSGHDKLLALLTPEQKATWDEMAGPTFSGEFEFRRQPRGN